MEFHRKEHEERKGPGANCAGAGHSNIDRPQAPRVVQVPHYRVSFRRDILSTSKPVGTVARRFKPF